MALGDTDLWWLWQGWGRVGFAALRGLFQPKYSMTRHLITSNPGVLVSPKADQGIHTGKGKNPGRIWVTDSKAKSKNSSLKCKNEMQKYLHEMHCCWNIPQRALKRWENVPFCAGMFWHVPREAEVPQSGQFPQGHRGCPHPQLQPRAELNCNSLCSTLPSPQMLHAGGFGTS